MEPKQESKLENAGEHKPRHRSRRNRRGGDNSHAHTPAPVSFHGEHEKLQGWVYTYDTAARAYQYNKTTEAITEWVNRNLEFSEDIAVSIEDLEDPDVSGWTPAAPSKEDDEKEDKDLANKLLNEEIKEYMSRKRAYKNNKRKVFSVVIGQCDEALRAKLEGQTDWKDILKEKKLVDLMKSIKKWLLNQQETRSPIPTKLTALFGLLALRQGRFESLTEYRRKFIAASEVLKHMEVGITFSDMSEAMMKEPGNGGKEAVEQKIHDKILASQFLMGVDKTRFGEVYTHLENEYISAVDKWPADVTEAYNLLNNWQKTRTPNAPASAGVSFAQGGSSAARFGGGTTGTSRPRMKVICYACGGDHLQSEGKCKPDDVKAWQTLMKRARDGTLDQTTATTRATMNHMTTNNGRDGEDRDDANYTLTGNPAAEPTVGHHNGVSWCMGSAYEPNTGQLLDHSNSRMGNVMTHSFNERRAYVIPRGSVGLDSMSSVDVFGERRLLNNIRHANGAMHIQCNAGEVVVTQVGDLHGYGTVWYHPEAIANILSLSRVQRRFKVTYDSERGNAFTMHRADGTTREFKPTAQGLYTSTFARSDSEKKKKAVAHINESDVVMVSTVADNAKSYTRREVKRAEEARRLMAVVGRPSEARMRRMVGMKELRNCDVTEQDVINAYKIFGPDVGGLKGRTTRRTEPHVELHIQPIPSQIMKRHREVTICFDVMFVCGLPFAVSVSRAIKFGTVEVLLNRKAETLLASLKRVKATYARRGFTANKVLADNEFRSLDASLSAEAMTLNVVSRGEHVPEIERHIRTLKERCRSIYNSLPFKKMPNAMVVELVCCANFWLHAFPAEDGVSAHISPRELVSGIVVDARKHCRIPFGQYAQVHEEHGNSMDPRTEGAIALRPTGNAQGGHFFFNLETGKRIVRNHWTEVPATTEVISRIERMAENRAMNRLTFGDRHNAEDDYSEDDDEVSLTSSSSSDVNSGNDSESSSDSEGGDDEGAETDNHDCIIDSGSSPHGKHVAWADEQDESDQGEAGSGDRTVITRTEQEWAPSRAKPEPELEPPTNESQPWGRLNDGPPNNEEQDEGHPITLAPTRMAETQEERESTEEEAVEHNVDTHAVQPATTENGPSWGSWLWPGAAAGPAGVARGKDRASTKSGEASQNRNRAGARRTGVPRNGGALGVRPHQRRTHDERHDNERTNERTNKRNNGEDEGYDGEVAAQQNEEEGQGHRARKPLYDYQEMHKRGLLAQSASKYSGHVSESESGIGPNSSHQSNVSPAPTTTPHHQRTPDSARTTPNPAFNQPPSPATGECNGSGSWVSGQAHTLANNNGNGGSRTQVPPNLTNGDAAQQHNLEFAFPGSDDNVTTPGDALGPENRACMCGTPSPTPSASSSYTADASDATDIAKALNHPTITHAERADHDNPHAASQVITVSNDARPAAPLFDAAALSGLPDQLEPLVSTLLTQHGIKRGLKIFGSDGDAAVEAEMRQLHDFNVLAPGPAAALTKEQKREALQYLMFLKKKRDGRVKGRGCADGRKQRANTAKSEVSSPTIATESVFLVLVIAAKEKRDVVTMDVPGAFLQTPLKDECVYVRLDGRMAELLTLIDPKLYRPNVIMERGKPVLYARLQRALYGMLQSALRFWEQVLCDLAKFGFVVNPYDRCVANREIDGAQQTVGWHVDDFLVTHINPGVNEQLVRWFDAKYGQRTPMTIQRGPRHEYLGMDVNMSQPGRVQITMYQFIDDTLAECPAEFAGTSVTPAGLHLFETSDEAPKVDEGRAGKFHHLTAKLLYLSKRSRPDIQLAVSFLCTRVRAPDEHDWKKLGRTLKYLRGTVRLPLTLEADHANVTKWWVDAAFAVSPDMRSHTGGTMSMGKGSVYSASTRQRINTRSSTEAELVGANDFMPQVLWTRYFLEAQGYALSENILYQDNQSAILLETNGKKSSGRRTRHINISYFFISDRVASGELSVEYCPTSDMRGDFFTKPLQGEAFRRFRREILNLDPSYE